MDRKEKWLEKGQKKNIWKIFKSWRVGKVLWAETKIIRESFEDGGVQEVDVERKSILVCPVSR